MTRELGFYYAVDGNGHMLQVDFAISTLSVNGVWDALFFGPVLDDSYVVMVPDVAELHKLVQHTLNGEKRQIFTSRVTVKEN